jgi:hypothetical protein
MQESSEAHFHYSIFITDFNTQRDQHFVRVVPITSRQKQFLPLAERTFGFGCTSLFVFSEEIDACVCACIRVV